MTQKKITTVAGWIVFGMAMMVYFMSAERTGSLWDCGEFVLGAYKLQVVHPPGAPLFLIVGRLFTWVADVVSSDPANIAFAVNLMSGMFTAFAATFVAWSTMIMSRLAFVGRGKELDLTQTYVTAGAGIVAGLATAFCSSIWFSAVEGEVYAMSTFFTAMTAWAMIKWYGLPKDPMHDRWIVFAMYSAGLSIGVHLLSLLTFPALALLYYFKTYEKHSIRGALIAMAIGMITVPVVQGVIIVGVPALWGGLELFSVNSLGMPFHFGLFPLLIMLGSLITVGIRLSHQDGPKTLDKVLLGVAGLMFVFALIGIYMMDMTSASDESNSASRLFRTVFVAGCGIAAYMFYLKSRRGLLQRLVSALAIMMIGYSAIGIVVIRANANPPINMNSPSDAMRLIPYLNREQYGERPLFRGPHFDALPVATKKVDRYGQVGDRYEVIDHKISYVYDDKDKMLLPRIGHNDSNRPQLHRLWMGDRNRPADMAYNMEFMFRYQIGWMYVRYFMWNFVGRQNGEQGYYPWNPKSGHWLSGIAPIDGARLYNQSKLPDTIKKHQARNKYFFLPLIFGFIGFFWQLKRRRKDWVGLMMLFLATGLGIIFYSNQPPNEPRERDYVLVGSFFTFCMWMGLAVPAIYEFARKRLAAIAPKALAFGATALVLVAPAIMAFQNFDDHSRHNHTAARDYASNFLESCDPNAIIFTYGDNDTYPLWYAQEVEGIRRDVRVVNLSLIAVDWYINGLNRKVNDSPPIKLSISDEAYRGDARNSLFPFQKATQEMPLDRALRIMGESHPVQSATSQFVSYLPSTNLYIPVDRQKALQSGFAEPNDTAIVSKIPIKLNKDYVTKDEMAVLDIIMSNIYERPIYFSVTCKEDRLMGLHDYTQLEGLGLRIVPVRTPSNRNFFIYGSGRVKTDEVYDRVMNKWRWGNFDKERLFVDNSYGASIQAQQMIIWRTSQELLNKGELDKVVDLTDKYFEAFPHKNFPYTARTLVQIEFYSRAREFEKAKTHMRILATELADWMEFYDSIKPEKIEAGFANDYQITAQGIQQILQMSRQFDDEAFAQEMQNVLGQYSLQDLQN